MIELISIIVLMIVIFLILFWLKKTLFLLGFFFKLFLLFMLVCVVGSVVFGYMVVKDANNFKNNFSNSTSMVIIKQSSNNTENNTKFLAGVAFNPEKKQFDTIPKKDLVNAEKLYNEDKMTALGADYYKVFIIELKSFDEIPLYNISDQNIELTKEEIKAVMISDNAREVLADIIAKKNGKDKKEVLKDLAATDEEVKSYLLSYYLSTVFNPNNPIAFLSQLKSENIQVYNNTALFKAIKLVPESIISAVIKN
jgi:hypothetical protein